jgi:hypothetical protein
MVQITAITLGVLVISLAIAGVFIARSRPWHGVVLGLLPLGAMELVARWATDAGLRSCIDSACAAAGLPPGCEIARFGCTEGSGLGMFLFIVAGVVALGLYVVGTVIMTWAFRRWRQTP